MSHKDGDQKSAEDMATKVLGGGHGDIINGLAKG